MGFGEAGVEPEGGRLVWHLEAEKRAREDYILAQKNFISTATMVRLDSDKGDGSSRREAQVDARAARWIRRKGERSIRCFDGKMCVSACS